MEGSSKGLTKGAWTAQEDGLLRQCVDKYGEGKWHQVPLRAGLNRCRKSCRLRWLNYLNPSIKRGKLSSDEVDLLLRLHKLLGNRWSLIAGRLLGRTANDVKNYWNTHLSKEHGPCSKNKMKKTIIVPPSSITPTQKVNVFKPRPRSFSINNGCSQFTSLPEVGEIPSCLGLNNNNACDNDKEKDEFMNNLMNEDNMWLKSLLEESQDGATLAFDVEQLWNSFDGETKFD